MADAAQMGRAWGQLWTDPNGVGIHRINESTWSIWAKRLPPGADRQIALTLVAASLAPSKEATLQDLGWIRTQTRAGVAFFEFQHDFSYGDDPSVLFGTAARAIEAVSAEPTSTADLVLYEVDRDRQAREWTRAGSLFAIPGTLLGLFAGIAAAPHLRLPLPQLTVGVLAILGAALAYGAGALIGGLALKWSSSKFADRRARAISYAGWFLGSIVAPLVVGQALWMIMGW